MKNIPEYTIVAATTFGLESVLAYELKRLGYSNFITENGRISFRGVDRDIARCNIWLRVADRVMIEIAKFKANDFEELFQGTLKIGWEEIIPFKGKMHVVGKSVKSKLFSVRDCQSTVKKAVIEAMKRRYRVDSFEESGPVYRIEVALLGDIATLTIDTTGPGLHKRGYREGVGEAPLRETLAAGLVMLSRWNPAFVLADPFCGSGTIPIEAAMIGNNIAPGLKRGFASEKWPQIPEKIWSDVRSEASAQINNTNLRILASDADGRILKKARENSQNAGVDRCISFQKSGLKDFSSSKKYGYMICNPPYGERTGDKKEIEMLYKSMGDVFKNLDSWSLFVLTSHEGFEKYFGRKADKNRKLYNGDIKCYYYQYIAKKTTNSND